MRSKIIFLEQNRYDLFILAFKQCDLILAFVIRIQIAITKVKPFCT